MAMLTLYTGAPASQGAQAYAAYLELYHGCTVRLRPLSDLPPPDRRRPTAQQLRTERADVAAMLHTLAHAIAIGEQEPHRFVDSLVTLRYDQARHQGRLAVLDRALGAEKGGVEL